MTTTYQGSIADSTAANLANAWHRFEMLGPTVLTSTSIPIQRLDTGALATLCAQQQPTF